jgi:hypothetical protein
MAIESLTAEQSPKQARIPKQSPRLNNNLPPKKPERDKSDNNPFLNEINRKGPDPFPQTESPIASEGCPWIAFETWGRR